MIKHLVLENNNDNIHTVVWHRLSDEHDWALFLAIFTPSLFFTILRK